MSDSLTIDVTCAACGYNLRGLHVDARCPECAHPVDMSLRLGNDHWAEPACILAVRQGVAMIAGAMALATAALVVDALTGARLVAPFAGSALGLYCCGAWKVANETGRAESDPLWAKLRRWVRALVVVSAALGAWCALRAAAGWSEQTPLVFSLPLLWCVLAYATMHYVEDVARRARLWSASQGLGTVKWWLPLSVAAPWLILYPPHPFDPALRAAAYLCGGPLLLGAVAVSLVALVQVIIGLRPPAWTS